MFHEYQIYQDLNLDPFQNVHQINYAKKYSRIYLMESNVVNHPTTHETKKQFGCFIFELVKDYYNNTLLKRNKPQTTEWTHHASIILENNKQFKPVIYSNGNKSLPNKNYYLRNYQIFDSHAEILAMKCFKLFLIKCLSFSLIKRFKVKDWNLNNKLIQVLSKDEYDEFNQHNTFYEIFAIHSLDKKIALNDNVRFHLFLSHIPCGSEKGENTATVRECFSILTGTQSIIEDDCIQSKFLKAKCNPCDTTKIDNISLSLSCFDKLLFKSIMGIQGKYLNAIIQKVFLSSITISNNSNEDGIEIDLINSFTEKGKRLIEKDTKLNLPQIIEIKEQLTDYNGNYNQRNIMPYSYYWAFPSIQGKLDPVTGLKCGNNLNNINQLEKYRSMLCEYDLCYAILSFIQSFPQLDLTSRLNQKISLYYYHNAHTNDIIKLMASIISSKDKQIKAFIDTENKAYTKFKELKLKYFYK